MAETLRRLGNNSELGKVLLELLGEIATSAVSKGNQPEEEDAGNSSFRDARDSKCVSVSPKEGFTTPRLSKSDDESEHAVPGEKTVDPSLGRPRYQWHVPEKCSKYQKDRRKPSAELKELFSVYVGHLPIDITEDELVDLFKDIGEVIDAFVLPNQSSNGYTYGFVRFLTIDEAEDAVREKHLKVIGKMQIHVEISADTRRKLQDNDAHEESRQLLRKDYPRVIHRPVGDSDEKKVITKVKSSLRKLNEGSRSCLFGECSSEELFENVKAILKMTINYPMCLTDATADEGNVPSRITKRVSCNKDQSRDCGNDEASLPVNKDSLVPSFPITGRLPSPISYNPNSMHNNTNEHHECSDTSSLRDANNQSSLSSRQVIEEECPTSNSCPLVNKVRHFLNSSSSENIAISSDSPSINNSESCSSPNSWPTCKMQSGSVVTVDTNELPSSAPQHGMNTHYDAGLGSLVHLGDGRPNHTSPAYVEVREKNVMACVSFDQQPNASPMPSYDVGHSSRQNVHQISNESFLDIDQEADTVFVPCNQTSSKDASHFNSSQQNAHLTNGRQFVMDSQRTNTVFVSCDQLPKTSLLPSNGASHGNRFCSQLNGHQTNGAHQSVEVREKTDVTFVSLNQRPKVSSLSHKQFSSDMEIKLSGDSTYPNLCSSVPSITDLAVEVPVEITKSVCQGLSSNIENANENPTKASIINSPHLKSLQRCGQQLFFSAVPRETAATKLSLSNSNHSDYMHIDSTPTTNLLKDQSASASEPCSLSQSPRTDITNAFDSRSTVLNNVSSDSNSDVTNATKSEVVVCSDAVRKPSHETRCRMSPCIQDVSPPCNSIDTDSFTPRSSQFNEIHTSANPRTCLIQECNSAPNTNGKLGRATLLAQLHGRIPSRDTASSSREINGDVSSKDGVVKSPSRRERTLAPSFSKPIVKRNSADNSECKPTNVPPKVPSGIECRNGSSSSEIVRPSGEVLGSNGVKNIAGAEMMVDDSAIVNVSKGNSDLRHLNLSPCSFDIDCSSRADFDSGFESSVARNNVEHCHEEDDAETKMLKQNLKHLYRRLQGLQQILSSRPRGKRTNICQWFEDDSNNMELETQIHDTEVLLQKKNESWTSRFHEKELAFEREKLQSVNNTERLKQLSKQMRKEYLRNEICVTELQCNIVELKIRPFKEDGGIEV